MAGFAIGDSFALDIELQFAAARQGQSETHIQERLDKCEVAMMSALCSALSARAYPFSSCEVQLD
jgi:hypothetical protein